MLDCIYDSKHRNQLTFKTPYGGIPNFQSFASLQTFFSAGPRSFLFDTAVARGILRQRLHLHISALSFLLDEEYVTIPSSLLSGNRVSVATDAHELRFQESVDTCCLAICMSSAGSCFVRRGVRHRPLVPASEDLVSVLAYGMPGPNTHPQRSYQSSLSQHMQCNSRVLAC